MRNMAGRINILGSAVETPPNEVRTSRSLAMIRRNCTEKLMHPVDPVLAILPEGSKIFWMAHDGTMQGRLG